MKNIEIKNHYTKEIIICGEYESIKDCLEKNLRYANLSNADLYNADLHNADLRYADLHNADLSNADLHNADLSNADLHNADLHNADLYNANLRNADLYNADLRYANLYNADLYNADLYNADLSNANLRNADLHNADLRYANLSNADLHNTDLRYAKYKEPLFLPDLYSLKLLPQKTKLTYWKYLKEGKSPYQNMEYKIGEEYKFKTYNADEQEQCGEGGNVATLIWCLKDSSKADEFIECEFKVSDIIAIPYSTDGKFRVKKLKVLRKINRKEAIELLNDVMKRSR